MESTKHKVLIIFPTYNQHQHFRHLRKATMPTHQIWRHR